MDCLRCGGHVLCKPQAVTAQYIGDKCTAAYRRRIGVYTILIRRDNRLADFFSHL